MVSYLGHRGLSEKETSCTGWPGSFSSCVVGNVFIQDLSLFSRSVVSVQYDNAFQLVTFAANSNAERCCSGDC